MSILRKVKRCLIPSKPLYDRDSSFYTLSPTCQIPKLDVLYERYFGQQPQGCFVEIGAYDGEYVSNTSGLADMGWTGYYIEPVPEYFQRCKIRHRRNENITVSQYAIGAEQGEVTIKVGGPLSTIRGEMRDHFRSLEWAKSSFEQDEDILVDMLTLEEYLVKHHIQPQFELLVVDVEGYEWEVFRNFDVQRWQPQMVIVELHDQNDDYLLIRQECNNLVRYFDENSYKVIYKDFTNTVYVSKYIMFGEDA